MTNTPFPTDPVLTGLTIAYRNPAYIADDVLPRVPVGLQSFKWWLYPIEETFAAPDTKVGRRGQPNEIDLSATEETSSTEDHGLDDPIPIADILNAPPNHNPEQRATVQLTDYVALGRERRTAQLVFDPARYPAGNKITLAGTDQLSNFTASDPIGLMTDAFNACLMRPNIAVMGQEVYSKLSQHPAIVKAVNGTSGDSGIVRRRQMADLFELEEILVGQSRLNAARKGQPASLARVWGKHISLQYRDRNADTRSGLTFGYTAEWGGRIAGSMEDSKIGLRGGRRVRVGESVKELIVAGRAGYFIQDAVE